MGDDDTSAIIAVSTQLLAETILHRTSAISEMEKGECAMGLSIRFLEQIATVCCPLIARVEGLGWLAESWNRVKLALWARSFRECEASSVPTNLAINEDHRNAGCIMLQDKISQGDLTAMAGVARRASAES